MFDEYLEDITEPEMWEIKKRLRDKPYARLEIRVQPPPIEHKVVG